MLAVPASEAHWPVLLLSRKEMFTCGSPCRSSVLWDSVFVKKRRSRPPDSFCAVLVSGDM